MAVFNNNIENEEEKFGGFGPGADDESFSVENLDSYPGKLPDFNGYYEKTTEDFNISDILNESPKENIAAKEEPTTDLPQQPDTENNTETVQPETSENAGAEGNVWDIFNEDKNSDTETAKVETSDTAETVKKETVENDSLPSNTETEKTEPIAEPVTVPGQNGESIVLDDELLNLLKSDARQNTKNKENKAADNKEGKSIDDASMLSESKSFFVSSESDKTDDNVVEDMPVNSGQGETVEMDLSEIAAEHPSAYFPTDDAPKEQIADEKVQGNIGTKEKKAKKNINWKRYGMIAAIMLIVAALISSVCYFNVVGVVSAWFKPHPQEQRVDTTKKVKEAPVLAKEAPKKDSTVEDENKDIDTVKNNEIVIDENYKEELAPKHKVHKEQVKKPEKTVVKQQEKKNNGNKENQLSIYNNYKNKAVNVNKKDLSDNRKNNDTKKEKTSKTINTSIKHKEEKGIFVVQVYSSPSKDDAEDWLRKLKKRNMPNAGISTQIVRDKIWYRVRFGNFENREDAKATALKYGFSQSWIDRIR